MTNISFDNREGEVKRILVIDDEPAFTNVVTLTLEGTENYKVCVENDPCRAITTGREFRPDIIILDEIMPGMFGDELHRHFMDDSVLKHVPVIFLTAVIRQSEVDACHGRIGGAFVMAKPVSSDALINAIEDHLCCGARI